MKVDIGIANNGRILYPPVLDGVKVEWQRRAAGKMTFELASEDALQIAEGNRAQLQIDGKNMFLGFITRIARSKAPVWKITAMDSTWYLIRNKDTYNYQNKTPTQVIRMVADDYQLSCGQLAETGYTIKSRCEQDTSLMDIILNALDEAMTYTKQMHILYDDNGLLTLKPLAAMQLPLLIDADTAEDYDFSSSIEDGVYNKIKIVHEDTKAGKRSIYIAQDSGNIAKWGVLQLTDKVQTRATAQPKANGLLSLYNRPKRLFTVKDALGDPRVRGGSLLGCVMDLGMQKVMQNLIVDSVAHEFTNEQHLMKSLKLWGGPFSV